MTLALHKATVPGRLDEASLDLKAGEITAICGPNGAGKSTLLSVMAGLLRPEPGTATCDGSPLATLPARSRAQAIGYLPQNAEVAWDVDVKTLAGLGRLPWRASQAEDHAAIDAALAATDLVALAHRSVSQLSGGERARALLARVLAGEPRWILADEPLAALDLAHQAALLRTFRALANEGVGVVLVLHDLARAINGADRAIVLEGGRIVADGLPQIALSAERLAQTWGIEGSWIGAPGQMALSLS
ncbi:ABC transporter ATP-binding protein [Novosphingobium sp. Gsoil 351]|uniref:ABC transporter ATP-binding protein n=1 Tax=Novosphingobium sp. Gsoil 351 TaxID=2675225 RepID=UPI0012B49DA6|nr:ABC transporter ATP-binding protein [Novosphingobium sp. Gsoil 351]QGN54299.1 ATP-binding cassette domain-containing protein [Novosphingobium sp. Gsoil 351]